MSQPVDPYRDDPRLTPRPPSGEPGFEQPYADPRSGQPYGGQMYGDPRAGQPYGGQPYGEQPYGGQYPGDPSYGRARAGQPYGGQPGGAQPYGGPYDDGPYGREQYGGGQAYPPAAARHAAPGRQAPVSRQAPSTGRMPAGPERSAGWRPRRVPGLGLVFALLGLVVQIVSFTVLSWVRLGAGQPGAATPKVWQLIADHGAHGFGGWYLVAFSYPMAVLSIVLALASVFESVALKLIWAGLTVIGLAVLVLRYGWGPLATSAPHPRAWQIVLIAIAVGVLVVVIFVLRSAVAMFRRTAGLILLALAGVHVAAVYDLVRESGIEHLDLGAYGPALGYLLTAIAAFTGPRRLPAG
jgi:hypothetical protein